MRVAISGSRAADPKRGREVGWSDYEFVEGVVKRLLEAGHTINVGDAPSGVDYHVLMAHETAPWADKYPSSSLNVYRARWDVEGRRAGHNRNEWMVSESEMLIALFAPVLPLTPGTHDAVRCAVKKGIPVHVYFEPVGWALGLPEGV